MNSQKKKKKKQVRDLNPYLIPKLGHCAVLLGDEAVPLFNSMVIGKSPNLSEKSYFLRLLRW